MPAFLSRFVTVLLPLALAACGAEQPGAAGTPSGTTPPQAQSDMEGRYSGPVVPAAPNCGRTETGRLRFTPGTRTGRFTFEPSLGAALMYGEAGPDGTLRATPNAVGHFGPGGGPTGGMAFAGPLSNQPARLEATLRQDNGAPLITGTLTEGMCRWSVTLRRT